MAAESAACQGENAMTRLVTTRRRFMASSAAATIFAPTIVNA